MAMAITISKHQIDDATQETYDVTFFEHSIVAVVTATQSSVDDWVSFIEREYNRHLNSLVIGLDLETSPNSSNKENPVATLQLCVGRHCLIFQIFHSTTNTIPWSLKYFLGNSNNTCVGVGMENKVEKLMEELKLQIYCTADIAENMDADKYGIKKVEDASLEELARKVIGKELITPEAVTVSGWDSERLTPAQVQYACINAFLSFEIGKMLIRRSLK